MVAALIPLKGKLLMKALLTLTACVALVYAAAQPATAASTYSEDFDTGFAYAAGAVAGQNGWGSGFGAGMVFGATDGKGPSGGLLASTGGNGARQAHGVDLSSATTVTFAFDTNPGEGSKGSLFLTDLAGGNPYLNAEVDNGRSFDGLLIDWREPGGEAHIVTLATGITSQWYHGEMVWTVGGDLVLTVWDEANALVGSIATDASTMTLLPSSFTNVDLWAPGPSGSRFDNLHVSSGAIPEPSSLTAMVGLLAMVLVAWRGGR